MNVDFILIIIKGIVPPALLGDWVRSNRTFTKEYVFYLL